MTKITIRKAFKYVAYKFPPHFSILEFIVYTSGLRSANK